MTGGSWINIFFSIPLWFSDTNTYIQPDSFLGNSYLKHTTDSFLSGLNPAKSYDDIHRDSQYKPLQKAFIKPFIWHKIADYWMGWIYQFTFIFLSFTIKTAFCLPSFEASPADHDREVPEADSHHSRASLIIPSRLSCEIDQHLPPHQLSIPLHNFQHFTFHFLYLSRIFWDISWTWVVG